MHATSNENGDRTAAGWGTWEETYRDGAIRRVRFTVDFSDFGPWLTVLARYPEWTPDWINRLRNAAQQRGQPTLGWYCRPDRLPLNKVLAVHTRSYTGHSWDPFDLSAAEVIERQTDEPLAEERLGIKIGKMIFWSIRQVSPDGHDAYTIERPTEAAD